MVHGCLFEVADVDDELLMLPDGKVLADMPELALGTWDLGWLDELNENMLDELE